MAFSGSFGGVRRLVDRDGGSTNLLEVGADNAPVVLFVHGYPDTHAVWLPVMARLADRLRCVAYDVRGAGASTAPESSEGYRVAHLVSDLVAVIDAYSPSRPVHLVAHDWGSVQTWEAVLLAASDPRLRGRLASYTTISGPALGHFAGWIRRGLRGSWRQRLAVARQLAHSWYILGFQLPRLPELVLRWMLATPTRARRLLGTGARHAAPTLVRDAVNGLGLYRANLRGSAGPRHSLRTDLPVQLVVPTRDAYLTPAVYDDLPRLCADLSRHDIDAGHWVQQSHPDEVARLVADFVLAHETARVVTSPTEHPGSGEFGPSMGEFDRAAVSGREGGAAAGAATDAESRVARFVDDDEGYLAWLASHPDGHVVNTSRHPTAAYVVLHRATCRTISGTPSRGKHWTLDYIKVCGERADLERWALDQVGGPVHPCGLCLSTSPLDPDSSD